MAQGVPVVRASAPTRFCDAGGWTDTEHTLGTGHVTNMAIDLRTFVTIQPTNNGESIIEIVSEDLGDTVVIHNYRLDEYAGSLKLLQAAVNVMEIRRGMRVRVRADAPPGCGVGTSAAVSVALLGALHKFKMLPISPMKVARMAQELETKELKQSCGVQDQYAAALGGWNYFEIDYPHVDVVPITPLPGLREELIDQLILVYFGPRSSSKQHEQVFPKYKAGNPMIREAIENLKQFGQDMWIAVSQGNIPMMAEVMNNNWNAQKRLSGDSSGTGITTPEIERAHKIAFENGARAFGVNGAAGGGSATILAKPGYQFRLRKALMDNGFQILRWGFDFDGLRVWETEY